MRPLMIKIYNTLSNRLWINYISTSLKEEFTKGRQGSFMDFCRSCSFLAGLYVLTASPVFGHESIHPVISVAPFGISFIVLLIAALASIKRNDLFFLVDDGKIEFRYGIFRPKRHSLPVDRD